ncbi:MAG: DnaJ domain-containing protein [Polyangiales bacterium]
MPDTHPKTLAEGTLSATPLAHLLAALDARSTSGTLAIWPDDDRAGQDRIRFENGRPVAARFLQPANSLERGLLGLFARTSAPYAFYAEDLVGDKAGVLRGRVDGLALVMKACRSSLNEQAAHHVLNKLGDVKQRIRRDAPIDRLALTADERAFIEMVRAAPASANQLVQEFGDQELARRVMYVLAISRCLETYGSSPSSSAAARSRTSSAPLRLGSSPPHRVPLSSPPSQRRVRLSSPAVSSLGRPGSTPPQTRISNSPRSTLSGEVIAPRDTPPSAPMSLSAEFRAQWEEVVRHSAMIDRQNYFEMLGLRESAEPSEVSSRYLALVKRWHPDRLPVQLEPLRQWVEEIFHLITVARDTLSDPDRKKEYQKAVMQGGGTPQSERQISALVEAALEYQKVDILLKRRAYDEALEIVDRNIQVAPKEPDYPAMKARILMLRDGTDDPDVASEINVYLRKSLSLNPDHIPSLEIRAQLFRRVGEHDKAVAIFKKIVELNPHHMEALREVRVAKMRVQRGRSTAPPPAHRGGGGLLNKIFTGKKKP